MDYRMPLFDAELESQDTTAGDGCLAEKGVNSGSKLEEKALTGKQRELLAMYRETQSIGDLSIRLGLHPDTAREKIRDIRDALGCKSSQELLGIRRRSPHQSEIMEVSEADRLTPLFLLELIKQQDHRCALSGVALTPQDATLDHKIPISKGGTHDRSNVHWVHKDVNAAKGTMTKEEFLAMCQRVVHWNG